MIYAYPRRTLDLPRRDNDAAILYPEACPPRGGLGVKAPINLKKFRHPRRARNTLHPIRGQPRRHVGAAAPPARASNGANAPDQYGRRIALASGNDVDHPMHAVGEIDIPHPRRPEHNAVAGCHAARRMRGAIGESGIGLNLGDGERDLPRADPADEVFAKQRVGHRERRAIEKFRH